MSTNGSGVRRIGVVGGGIVGLAIARELTLRRPGAEVVVFEKETRLAAHQTGHNSGVVHAGIYYRRGTLKAELCARGRGLLRDYCADNRLPYDVCGKLVVSVDPSERARFAALEKSARANEVPGLRKLGQQELREIEPHVTGLAALHSPETAITDYAAVCETLGRDVESAGGRVILNSTVTGVQDSPGGVHLTTRHGVHRMDRLVICAGLQSDRVARLAGLGRGPRIVPFRGEYMDVLPSHEHLVNGLVYPVPDPRYPFLGVHFTRRVGLAARGALEVGPNAVLALSREGYERGPARPSDLIDLVDTATWPGTWRLARRHWRTGVRELRGSLSVRAYMRAAQRYVPEIGPAQVVRGSSGVRAQAVERDGALVDDFRIETHGSVTALRNAPSPAATSSLAIAEYIVDRMA